MISLSYFGIHYPSSRSKNVLPTEPSLFNRGNKDIFKVGLNGICLSASN